MVSQVLKFVLYAKQHNLLSLLIYQRPRPQLHYILSAGKINDEVNQAFKQNKSVIWVAEFTSLRVQKQRNGRNNSLASDSSCLVFVLESSLLTSWIPTAAPRDKRKEKLASFWRPDDNLIEMPDYQ